MNLLVLDEPTNHLDLPAIEQLEEALESFDGTVLLVTHDRRMLDTVRLTRRWHVDVGTGHGDPRRLAGHAGPRITRADHPSRSPELITR